jgi:hypothetical protein
MWLVKMRQHDSLRPPSGRSPGWHAAPRRGSRPRLEQLEARTVLTSFTAATVSDLVADIHAANQAGGANTITLVAPMTSPYVLTAVDNDTDGATGLPVIAANDNLTLDGNGDTVARSSAAGTPSFRLFDVAVGATVTLENLTLQGGLAFGQTGPGQGGAVYNAGTLDLNAVTVQNNTAQPRNGLVGTAEGGGLFSSGSLTLEGGTKVQNNQALGGMGLHAVPPNRGGQGRRALPGSNAYGGGVYVAGGTVTLNNSTFVTNSAQGGQGGGGFRIFIAGIGYVGYPSAAGGNGDGGALYVAAGTVTATGDTISGNTAHGGQGGDSYKTTGGPGGNGYGGAVYAAGATITLRNDTVTNNSALYGAGGSGTVVGTTGVGIGGGLYIDTLVTMCLDAFTQAHVTNNSASTSDPNIHGSWKPI